MRYSFSVLFLLFFWAFLDALEFFEFSEEFDRIACFFSFGPLFFFVVLAFFRFLFSLSLLSFFQGSLALRCFLDLRGLLDFFDGKGRRERKDEGPRIGELIE